MVDEADEFVTGTQGKGKRPIDTSTPTGAPKRRRCMSPLLRLGRAYTPPNKTPPRGDTHTHTSFSVMFQIILISVQIHVYIRNLFIINFSSGC